MFELVKPGTNIDFIGKRRICVGLSIAMLLASLVATQTVGIKLGIDFAGGTEIQVQFDPEVTVSEGPIRAIVTDVEGIDDPSVVRYGEASENEYLIKFKGLIKTGDASVGKDKVELIQEALGAEIGPLTVQRVEFVGPRG